MGVCVCVSVSHTLCVSSHLCSFSAWCTVGLCSSICAARLLSGEQLCPLLAEGQKMLTEESLTLHHRSFINLTVVC